MSNQKSSKSRLYALLVFLTVIIIGESFSLLLEYQNNSYLRDYIAQNTSAVTGEILGIIVLGLGLGYVAARRSPSPMGRAKGPGIFHRLGDIVTRRHRVVILVWILILLASLPLALNVNSALTSQNQTGSSNSDSARAQQLITDQFPHQQANSSALIVLVGSDVTSNATKNFVLDLETGLTAPGVLSSFQNFTSIYSVERAILTGTITGLAPQLYSLVQGTNASAFIVYGVPSAYLQVWVPTFQGSNNAALADSTANNATLMLLSNLAPRLGTYAPVANGYYQEFYQSWRGLNSTADPVLRAGLAVNSAVPIIIAPPTPASLAGILTAVWEGLSFSNWNQTLPLFHIVQTILSTGSPLPPFPVSFLQSIYALGPNPSPGNAKNIANSIIANGTLSTYPLLPSDLLNQFVSPKNDTMLVIVDFSESPQTFGTATSDPLLKDVTDMRQIAASLLALDHGPSKVYVTGDLATTTDSSAASNADISRIDPVTIGAILVLVGVFFFAVITPIVPLATIGMALLVADALVYIVSKLIVPIQDTTLTFLFTVMLGVGTDYAIFLIARYREERTEGRDKNEAVHTSVKWVGESIATSGMTVILSFGVMAISSFAFLKSLGIGISAGVLIALLVSLTLIPAVLTLAGDRVFWPNSGKRFEARAASARAKRASKPSYFRRAATFSAHRPKTILLLALVLTIPAAYVVFTYQTTYDFVAGLPNTESVQGLNVLQQGFGAGLIGPTQVVAQFPSNIMQANGINPVDARALENLSLNISSLSNVAKVTGPTRPNGSPLNVTDLSRLNPTDAAAVRSAIGADNRTVIITATFSEEPFTVTSLNTVKQIRDTVATLQASDSTLKSAVILVGGQSASTADFAAQTNDQFNIMRIVVIAGIFVILLLVLGSYILPLAAILSIGLSIVWSAAATIIFFKTVLNSDVIFIIPLILFLLLFGIGMDYNIFILTRIREEAQKGKPSKEAVIDAVDRTGGIITALALILGSAIGSLMLSSNRLLEGFGFAISLAVILDAMVVRTYLVPAAMSLLGRWAWWGPRRLRRVAFDEKDKMPGPAR